MKEILKKLNIDEGIANQILTKYDEDIAKVNQDLQDKTKALELKETEFNTVKTKLEDLEKVDVEAIKNELKTARQDIKKLEENHKTELDSLKIDNAISSALIKNGAINNKAVLPFVNKEAIKFDEKGSIVGLNEQIQNLIRGEETSFLFKQIEQPNIKGLDIKNKENAVPGQSMGQPKNNNYINQAKFQIGKIPNYAEFEQQYNNQ